MPAITSGTNWRPHALIMWGVRLIEELPAAGTYPGYLPRTCDAGGRACGDGPCGEPKRRWGAVESGIAVASSRALSP